ncbi:MAG: hypothetical protein DUD27_05625 [Lachnospiraceae bacterium]|uniref:4'-phosphopantetheinyl transferase superfamily protein n=1 Tax=Candidatus Weimeria bifida TaxID=2599074 RepID=A0A6N7IWT7_9FIRM|nr:4'-phosphopantetheinyl transferase superfamily protein [Candidatus Weimeria bifida]RRF96267.1 MAG: hypothetical protein DUD27_05625 [Lachnospiraceae bacterium]
MTDIFFIEKDSGAACDILKYEQLMHPYRHERDSWEYRAASALIFKAFEAYGIEAAEYREAESGRPYIASGRADFSVSHSGNTACVAITDTPGISIGIDIEEKSRARRRDVTGLSRRFFSEEEAFAVEGSEDRTDEFLRLWTMKEAMMKARRVPLYKTLRSSSDSHFYIENDVYTACVEFYSLQR